MPLSGGWTEFHDEWAEPCGDGLSCAADPFDDFDEDDFDDDFDDDFEEEWDDELAGDTEFQSDLAEDEGGDADFDD
jgi:hypothetical protein